MKGKHLTIITVILLPLILLGCSSSRKLAGKKPQHTEISPDTLQARAADTAKRVPSGETIYEKVMANHIGFTTFTAKMKIDFENNKTRQQGITANIRIQKDSLIWIYATALLGFEVARILITKDSIFIVDRLKKEVYRRNLDYVRDLLHIPVTLSVLQDLLVGNPVYLSDSISDVKQTPSVISFTATHNNLFNRVDVFADDFLLQQSYLTTTDTSQFRSCDLTYGDYNLVDSHNFPSRRKIFVESKAATIISINTTKADFNVPLNFPFNIPPSYDEE